jgi:hypothetical protein
MPGPLEFAFDRIGVAVVRGVLSDKSVAALNGRVSAIRPVPGVIPRQRSAVREEFHEPDQLIVGNDAYLDLASGLVGALNDWVAAATGNSALAPAGRPVRVHLGDVAPLAVNWRYEGTAPPYFEPGRVTALLALGRRDRIRVIPQRQSREHLRPEDYRAMRGEAGANAREAARAQLAVEKKLARAATVLDLNAGDAAFIRGSTIFALTSDPRKPAGGGLIEVTYGDPKVGQLLQSIPRKRIT